MKTSIATSGGRSHIGEVRFAVYGVFTERDSGPQRRSQSRWNGEFRRPHATRKSRARGGVMRASEAHHPASFRGKRGFEKEVQKTFRVSRHKTSHTPSLPVRHRMQWLGGRCSNRCEGKTGGHAPPHSGAQPEGPASTFRGRGDDEAAKTEGVFAASSYRQYDARSGAEAVMNRDAIASDDRASIDTSAPTAMKSTPAAM